MKATGWRKIATGLWGWPTDPQTYGRLQIDATNLQAAVTTLRERTGTHITVTHLAARAVALALAAYPQFNSRLVFGRFLPRRSVDIFVLVDGGAGKDLSGVKVRGADRCTMADIARQVERESADIRAGGGGVDVERGKALLGALPAWLLRPLLRLVATLTTDFQVDLHRLGLPREAFGSAMVSSIARFGLPEGWSPLGGLFRVPILLLIGDVEPGPWVDGDRVVVRPLLTACLTMDHRWMDAHGLAGMVETFRAYLADPLAFELAAEAGGEAGAGSADGSQTQIGTGPADPGRERDSSDASVSVAPPGRALFAHRSPHSSTDTQ